MFFVLPSGGPGLGIFPTSINARVTVRGGNGLKGDVYAFDLVASDAATTSAVVGNAASIWANVVPPTAAMVLAQDPTVFCVLLEDVNDDKVGNACIYGIVDKAFIIGATGSAALGTDLVVTTAKNLDIVEATGEHIAGIALETVTTPTTRKLGKVFLNGFTGLFATAVT
jgi:hypothetical protein